MLSLSKHYTLVQVFDKLKLTTNTTFKTQTVKQYFVYILRCKDGSYYTGITNDLERRFEEHNNGLNIECYTYKRRPLKLVFHERFPDVNQAIDFEKQVKGWRRVKKEALINGDWHLLPELSRTASQ